MIPRASAGYTVVYDGDCAVCLRFVDHLRRRDPEGTIELVAYREEGVPARFPWIDPARFEEALQLVGPASSDPDSVPPPEVAGRSAASEAGRAAPGRRPSCREAAPDAMPRPTWEGAAAIEQLLRVLPRGPRLDWMFRLPFARPLFAWGYRNFARNRRRFGCGKHCFAEPAGDAPPGRGGARGRAWLD